jgi:hypothetical protein
MSITSKNKWLILSSILLVVILAILYFLNFGFLMKRFGLHPINKYKTDNVDDTQVKDYPKQDSLKVDFSGLKNDTIQIPNEIIKTIIPELEGYNWNNEFQTEDLYSLYHQTVFAQPLTWDHSFHKKLIVIIFSNHGGNLYHAARGRVSLFEFQKVEKSWVMHQKYLAFGDGDEYGLEPLDCELVQIGINNKYAVIVHTSYSGNGGHDKQSQSVYMEVNHALALVFDFTNYEHYNDYPEEVEYTEGYSSMRILKSKKDYFDIETKSEETNWNDKTPGAIKHYKFNGKEYVEVKTKKYKKETEP